MRVENGDNLDSWTYDEVVQNVTNYYAWWDEQNAA